ncbi:ABC transporter substrate-binding protein [Microbacterium sp. 18062]|uniref:ABC transporter substrate-binding protein n=1 Tax=Microbacterium sp. 18062 TaxID=2681410 RepID=UPI001359F699|nr:ABC transporter substrate-binding protein [Microbacterium sp. 18062]
MRTALRPLTAAAALGALLLTGCSAADPAAESTEAGGDSTRVVTTDQGDVTVPTDPQRVVVLNYALAGYLYNLDVPVTAITPEFADTGDETYSDFWAEDAEEDGTEFLPWSSDGYDLESILAVEPDLIIGGGIGFPLFQAEQVYDELADIAPTVLVSGSFTTWQQQFSFLAEDVFDKGDEYADYVAAYDDRAAEVAAAITPPPGPSSFVAFTADGTAYALVESVGLPTEFAAVGIEPAPIFAEGDFEVYGSGNDMFELSTEQVGQVITQPSVFVMGFSSDDITVESLSQNPVYASLPAFQSGNAYDLPQWALRGDYDEALALLDLIEEQFS